MLAACIGDYCFCFCAESPRAGSLHAPACLFPSNGNAMLVTSVVSYTECRHYSWRPRVVCVWLGSSGCDSAAAALRNQHAQ